jgi:hypothetical protein
MVQAKDTHTRHQSSSFQRNSPDWKCLAYLKGRLKRSKPDEKGDRQLFFEVDDGTLFDVISMVRPGTNSLLWMWSRAAELFNEIHVWSLYPESRFGKMGVTPVCVIQNPDVEVDHLQFSGSVHQAIDLANNPQHLPLFIGRNIGRGFHFMDLTVPQDFELPDLQPRQWVRGTAKRQGTQWMLQTLALPSLDDE